jgi:hypothetical protein
VPTASEADVTTCVGRGRFELDPPLREVLTQRDQRPQLGVVVRRRVQRQLVGAHRVFDLRPRRAAPLPDAAREPSQLIAAHHRGFAASVESPGPAGDQLPPDRRDVVAAGVRALQVGVDREHQLIRIGAPPRGEPVQAGEAIRSDVAQPGHRTASAVVLPAAFAPTTNVIAPRSSVVARANGPRPLQRTWRAVAWIGKRWSRGVKRRDARRRSRTEGARQEAFVPRPEQRVRLDADPVIARALPQFDRLAQLALVDPQRGGHVGDGVRAHLGIVVLVEVGRDALDDLEVVRGVGVIAQVDRCRDRRGQAVVADTEQRGRRGVVDERRQCVRCGMHIDALPRQLEDCALLINWPTFAPCGIQERESLFL